MMPAVPDGGHGQTHRPKKAPAGHSPSTLNTPCCPRACRPPRLRSQSVASLLGGFHVDDLDPPVRVGKRIARVLQLGLAIAGGHQILGLEPKLLNEVALDRFRAPLGEPLVVLVATLSIGMASKENNVPL